MWLFQDRFQCGSLIFCLLSFLLSFKKSLFHMWYLILCPLLGHGASVFWSYIVLGVSVRVVLDELNFWLSQLSKAGYLLCGGWATSNQVKTKRRKRLSLLLVRGNSSCQLSRAVTSVLSWFRAGTAPSPSWASGLSITALGTSRPPNCLSQFLIINPFVSLFTHPLGSASPKNLTHTTWWRSLTKTTFSFFSLFFFYEYN